MNANKCCYTIYSNGSKDDLEFDALLNGDSIPYNQNSVFLGVTFDEGLCFNIHFENFHTRALSNTNFLIAHLHLTKKVKYLFRLD